ncbi:MAG: transglycosylase SLT domain-containing protein [Bacteriovoracaceae bacterium]|nr:transglycosylase SLT domain-containing protein [Bacteriovoracaceae bacterium]
MIKIHTWLPLLVLMGACATSQKTQNKTAQTGWRSFGEEGSYSPGGRIQQDIVDSNLTACDGCILGSSHHGTFISPLRVYELTGAEHLNLKNTHFDIPVVWNPAVAKWVNYFTGRGREWFTKYAERGGRYAPVLSKVLNDNGLPRDLIYLAMAESGFQNIAKSHASASGPWQFMSFTGRKYGLNQDWYKDERRDPLKASVAAAGYLKDLHDLFGSWELATAGYNAGEGKIGRAIKRYGTRDFWKLTKGRYLKPETKNYVPKIMALAIIGKNLSTFGFNELAFHHPLDYEQLQLPANTDLMEVSKVLDVPFEEIQRYNPELLRWQTPPDMPNYVLRIPVGAKDKWDDLEDKSVIQATQYHTWTSKKDFTLAQAAHEHRLPVQVLAALNPEHDGKRLEAGVEIKLPFRADQGVRDGMYADLYEVPRKFRKARRSYYRYISSVSEKGKTINRPSKYYVVKKGDTLWEISRKTGVSMDVIVRSNKLLKRRGMMPGDKLAIK